MNTSHQDFREITTPVLTKTINEVFPKQGQLAKAAGVSEAQLSLWKTGKAAPSLEAYLRLCRVCPELHSEMMAAVSNGVTEIE